MIVAQLTEQSLLTSPLGLRFGSSHGQFLNSIYLLLSVNKMSIIMKRVGVGFGNELRKQQRLPERSDFND